MSKLEKFKYKYVKLFSKRCVLATAAEQYRCYHDGPVEARYSRAYSMKGTNLTLMRSSRTVYINDRDVTTSPPRSRGRGREIDCSNSSILAASFTLIVLVADLLLHAVFWLCLVLFPQIPEYKA